MTTKERVRHPANEPDPTIGAAMTAQPLTIGRDQKLSTAHEMMRENHVRHLPVLEHGEIVGVLSQRDLYFLETIAGVDVDKDRVDDAMSSDCYTVPPETSVSEVAATMAERHLGSAIVVERGRVIGIFTATDALRLLGKRGKEQHPTEKAS
jgi:CBS domain-containing protein